MDNEGKIKITTRDKILIAWIHSMELVRNFEFYSKEIHDDGDAAKMFAKFAEEEGAHASKLREALHRYQDSE